MIMGQDQNYHTDEDDDFAPVSEFYVKKTKPESVAVDKEEKVNFSINERKTGKFSANVYIGQKVLDELHWGVGDKVEIRVHRKLPRIKIYHAAEDTKGAYTLTSSNAEKERMARVSFCLTDVMPIPMVKSRVCSVSHEVGHAHQFVPYLAQSSGKDYHLVIEIPSIGEEAPKDSDVAVEEAA